MRLSTKGRYAVMAMAVIASRGSREPVSLGEIASDQRLPVDYLEQLFLRLRRAGLVKASRGPGGGYVLAQPASSISIADIINAVEEPIRMTRCTGEAEDACLGTTRCITHHLWDALGEHIEGFLKSTSLQKTVDDAKRHAMSMAAPNVEEVS